MKNKLGFSHGKGFVTNPLSNSDMWETGNKLSEYGIYIIFAPQQCYLVWWIGSPTWSNTNRRVVGSDYVEYSLNIAEDGTITEYRNRLEDNAITDAIFGEAEASGITEFQFCKIG